MNDLLIQMSIGIAVYYSLYAVFFSRLTFFRYNRFILLSIPFLAWIAYSLRLNALDVLTVKVVLPIVEVMNQNIPNPVSDSIFNVSLLNTIYLVGVLISALILTGKVSRLILVLKSAEKQRQNNLVVCIGNDKYASFSFFNYVYINRRHSEYGNAIIRHESLHYRMLHSLDNLYLEVLKSFFWFNPFIYMLHRELRKVHEYEVDEVLKKTENTNEYLKEISKSIPVLKELDLSTPYNSNSNFLNRIIMTQKAPSNRTNGIRYFTIIPLTVLLMISASCSRDMASEESQVSPNNENNMEIIPGDQLKDLDVQPQFTGGIQAMYEFLGSAIKYPEEAKKKGLGGKVFISFVISNTGKIVNVKVVKGIHPLLDEEALRAISSMPNWTPGELNGKKVAVEYFIPVLFTLPEA